MHEGHLRIRRGNDAQLIISFSRMSRLDDFSGFDKRRRSHSAECRLTLSSFLRTLMLQFALQYLAR